ncbi:MAG: MarC family protein [Puniceicoccales bacterium]|jgi:multiple antibiotic resistance protein|nr:MarC family protein [Puniceicoccales bacterium]
MQLSNVMMSAIGVCIEGEYSFFVNCFFRIFVAMCPLAIVVLYLSMTPSFALRERLAIARTSCLVAWGVMILTALGGPKALEAIGIAMEAFNIAGGLLLIVVGFAMLRSEDPEIAVSKNEATEIAQLPKKKRQDIAITPLGVPIIAGPGALAVVLSNRVASKGNGDLLFCLLAISLAVFLMYLLLVVTSRGAKWLTPTILKLSFRLSGLFLIAIGMQLAMNGLRNSDLLASLGTKTYIIN